MTDRPAGSAEPSPAIIEMAGRAEAGARSSYLVLPHAALCGEGRAGWISVALPSTRPLLVRRARQRLEVLRGHLTRAVDIALELAHARDANSYLATLLSALPTAALMLNAGGQIMQANSAARAILNAGDDVHQTRERCLRATHPDEDQKLAFAIQTSMSARREGATAERRTVQVRGAMGLSLLIILDPITSQQHAPANEGTRLLLRMVDAKHPQPDRTYPLQAAFDLTAAEMRIAALIATGLSPALAARRLDVSTNTVRTHLLRVFDKTGVRSQHALTLLLAAIGSWPLT